MFSYHKIVFGIKHRYRISDVLKIFKQQRSYSILISQHNATDVDDCCDRPDVHYHGVVEFNNGEGQIGNLILKLSPYCHYIRYDPCSCPAEYLAYITLEPKRIIAQENLNSSKLLEYLRTASNKIEVLGRKKDRKASLLERNTDTIKLVDIILKSGYNGNNIISQLKKNEPSPSASHKIFETALSVSQKIVLNSSILDLSNRFALQDGYLSPEESAQFVLDWCLFQKLDTEEFIKNLIQCLDRKSENRNSIYLQGSGNSGKSYIVQSIIEACIYVGQVIVESSAYSFVWENCVDKRLIVLKEPHFSMINFDQLDKILSGSGTLIYKHNDVVDYVVPTPVIILANEHDWIDDPQLRVTIKKRLCCYMGLKNFPNTIGKKLHPRWLSLLNDLFFSRNSLKADQRNSTTYGRSFESNPDAENGMQFMTEEPLNDVDAIASSHSLKTSGDWDSLMSQQTSMLTKQGTENTMQPDAKYRKRPIGEIKHDGGRNKMNRCDEG